MTTCTAIALLKLESDCIDVLKCMLEAFGNKSFLLHQAQAFPQHPLEFHIKKKEAKYLKQFIKFTSQMFPCLQILYQAMSFTRSR